MQKYSTIALTLFVGIAAGIVADETWTARFGSGYIAPPSQPLNVPSSARWEGGPDGGMWFECKKEAEAMYRCSVFADETGVEVVSDLYTAVPESFNGTLRPVLLRSDTEIELMGARLVRLAKAK